MKQQLFQSLYKVAVVGKRILNPLLPAKLKKIVKKSLLYRAYPLDQISTNRRMRPREKQLFKEGINLIGYARAEMGIGESCRIAAKSLDAIHFPFGIINFKGTNSSRMTDTSWSHKENDQPIYGINIFHINAEQMMEVYADLGNKIFEERYNIGYWHWELPDFPDEWVENFRFVDEVWVPSTFVADSISFKSPVPVVRIPHCIRVDISSLRDREYFQLPKDPFLFLSMYDAHSYQARKNPMAAIRAFQEAFGANDQRVGLVVKVNNSRSTPGELSELERLVSGYRNIYLLQETYSRNDVNALLSVIDCFVSMHRSEGFGLGLAEAMYLGKAVIATNWSSNTDFMNLGNSCLVDYKLIQLGQDYGPYKAYQYWADPDIQSAADYMRRLVEYPEYYHEIATRGQETIREQYSPEIIGNLIRKRLQYIQQFGGGIP
ncbi:glycosyl transferase family 1 [Paenibacillus elgii]|uniref:Glycosyl transferase family 1 n=1 Tax=Paenibacillus elgii TaxID=189691 RepID=A0A161TTN9_9BACL|nr:glycosyltransferase family 4 protein [Paenibacillus elgii]KZE70493.1 glycosyl transferase family 1 [Paenibacillus elgii]